MNSKVGMMALLEGTEKMAALDWRVAPVPWRNHLANPGRPLKVHNVYYTMCTMFTAVYQYGIKRRVGGWVYR